MDGRLGDVNRQKIKRSHRCSFTQTLLPTHEQQLFSQSGLKNVSTLKDDKLVIFMTIISNCTAASYRKLISTTRERKFCECGERQEEATAAGMSKVRVR